MWPSLEWKRDKLILIDQRLLPAEEVYLECRTGEEVAQAIETLVIRGAPAIGIAAAYGVVLAVRGIRDKPLLQERFEWIVNRLRQTRPTARNLFWALERMVATLKKLAPLAPEEIVQGLEEVAALWKKRILLATKK